MSISKKKARQRRIGSRRNRRRFACAERLESRILLDGSGGLGANAADDHAVITNSFDYYELSYSYQLGLDALAGQLLGVQGDQGTDDGNSVAAGNGNANLRSLDLYIDFGPALSPLASEGSPLTFYFDEADSSFRKLADSALSSIAYEYDASENVVSIIARSDESVDESPSAVRMHADSLHGKLVISGQSGQFGLFAYSSGSLVATSLTETIDDPVFIPMPSQSVEFLPAESLPAHRKQNRLAFSVPRGDQPEIESSRTAIAAASASESREPKQEISPHNATDAGSTGTALSSDRYFASYARRTSAGMSTHTAASESRQHVIATVHHVAPDRGTGDGTPLVSFQSRSVSTSSATGGTAATWWATRAKQVVAASRPDGIDPTSDVHLTRLTPGNAGVTEPGLLDRDPRGNDVTLRRSQRVRDLALSIYEPVSFVVGISLVSAHAIAETNGSDKKRSQALRKR